MSKFCILVLLLVAFNALSVGATSNNERFPLAVVRSSLRARQLIGQQKNEEAIELLTQVLKSYPDSAELLARRGQARIYIEQNDAAFADFEKALKSANLSLLQCPVMISASIEAENYKLALKVYTKGKTLPGSVQQRASFLYQSGCLMRRTNKRPEAIVLLTEANKIMPNNLDHWEELILVYADLKQWDLVISTTNLFEKANKAPDKRSGLARIYDRRGNAYMYKKQYREAIADWNKAINISPLSVAYLRKRAECYGQLGDRLAQRKDELKVDEICQSIADK